MAVRAQAAGRCADSTSTRCLCGRLRPRRCGPAPSAELSSWRSDRPSTPSGRAEGQGSEPVTSLPPAGAWRRPAWRSGGCAEHLQNWAAARDRPIPESDAPSAAAAGACWCQVAGRGRTQPRSGEGVSGSLDTGQRGPTGLSRPRLSRHSRWPRVAAAGSPGIFTVSLEETGASERHAPQGARDSVRLRLFLRGLRRGLFPGRGLEETPAPPCRLSPSLQCRPPPTSAWAPLPGLGPPVKAAQPLPPGRSHPSADGVEDASGPGPVCPAPRRAFWPCEAKTPTVRAAGPSPGPGTSLRPGDRAGRPILTGLRPLPRSLQSLPWAVLSALKTPPSRAEGWERGTPPAELARTLRGWLSRDASFRAARWATSAPGACPTPRCSPCRRPGPRALLPGSRAEAPYQEPSPAALCYP